MYVCLVALLATLFLSCVSTIPLIVDTDADVDDLWAIAYLLRKGADIKAITVVGNAWIDPPFSVPTVLQLLEELGCNANTGPVSYGSHVYDSLLDPSAGVGAVPATYKVAVNYYFETCLGRTLDIDDKPSPYTSVELILGVLRQAEEPVDILIMGSFTNLARAIEEDRSIVAKIGTLYVSGGNFDGRPEVPSKYPYTAKTKGSNWNVFVDPLAAQIVLTSGVKSVWFTGQAQDDLVVIGVVAQHYAKVHHVGQFWVDLVTKFYACSGQKETDIQYWDPSSAIMMLQQQGVIDVDICTEWVNDKVTVSLEEGGYFGRTIPSASGVGIKFCKHSNVALFLDEFWGALGKTTAKCLAPFTVESFDSRKEVSDLKGQMGDLEAEVETLKEAVGDLKSTVKELRVTSQRASSGHVVVSLYSVFLFLIVALF